MPPDRALFPWYLTIQTWWCHYRQQGATRPAARCDKHQLRKSTPEELLNAIEQVLPHFNNKRYNIAAIYKKCIELGFLEKDCIAENTFRRHVKRFDLLKPESQAKSKRRQAFSKQHANEMWQCDTLVGPYLKIKGERVRTYLICFIDDASRIIPHGQFYLNDNEDIRSRITQSTEFKSLSPNDILDYIQHQLDKCGLPHNTFTESAINLILKVNHGNLRATKNLCEEACRKPY
jgi:putative transposase